LEEPSAHSNADEHTGNVGPTCTPTASAEHRDKSAAPSGASRTSSLRTCALNRVDAYAYVKDVLDKLAASWPQQRIEELLPDAWAASRAAVQANAQAADQTA